MVGPRTICRRLLWSALVALAALYGGLVGLRVLYPIDHVELVLATAEEYGLDPALVASLIRAESRFRADAVSPRGAVGLMQIMPETATWIATQPGCTLFVPDRLLDPATNLDLGCWYLQWVIDRFPDRETALWAYNAGPARVEGWLAAGQAPFSETAAYAERVLRGLPIYQLYFDWPILVRITPSVPL